MPNPAEIRRLSWLRGLSLDVRLAARMILREPLFCARVALIIALGTCGATTTFSVFNAVVLQILPYKEAGRLFRIWTTPIRLVSARAGLSVGDLVDLRDETKAFDSLGAYRDPHSVDFTDRGEFERFNAVFVYGDFFKTLGVRPVLGRWILPSDNIPANSQVVVLSYAVWQAHFASDSGIIGRNIHLDKALYTIVGVMPQLFEFPNDTVQVWVPESVGPQLLHDHGQRDRFAFGRLSRGINQQEAQAELNVTETEINQIAVGSDRTGGVAIGPLRDEMVGSTERIFLFLFAATFAILLITCANVANLLTAKNAYRQRSLATMGVLGASPIRIFQQLLAESAILALLGTSLGLIISIWGLHLLRPILPPNISRLNHITVEIRVVGFAFFVAFLTGTISGTVPAFRFSHQDLSTSLKGGAFGLRRKRPVFLSDSPQRMMVMSQISLAVILTFCAGLLVHSLARLASVDIGFEPQNLSVIEFSRHGLAQRPLVYNEVLAKVDALPGIKSAALVAPTPLSGSSNLMMFAVESNARGWTATPPILYITVSNGYFSTMGIPVLRGRSFEDQDNSNSPCVAIINRETELAYWPDEDALGKRINLNAGATKAKAYYCAIIGLVGNARELDLKTKSGLKVYFCASQRGPMGYAMVVRTSSAVPISSDAVLDRVLSDENSQAPASVRTMSELVDKSIVDPRFRAILVGTFAVLALLLATIGVYSFTIYLIGKRSHEIGIRMALGAQRSHILQEIVRGELAGIVIGVALGLCGAITLGRFLESLLFEVKYTDSVTFFAVPLIVSSAALLATYSAAVRATKDDPEVLLRDE